MLFDWSVYSIQCANGSIVKGHALMGKLIAVVNTASTCGFSSKINDLADLHKRVLPSKWNIIAFPCNQFMGQEPLDNNAICQ